MKQADVNIPNLSLPGRRGEVNGRENNDRWQLCECCLFATLAAVAACLTLPVFYELNDGVISGM